LKDTIGFENIYVCPDLTQNQQEEEKKIKAETSKGKGGHGRMKIVLGQVLGYVDGKEEVLNIGIVGKPGGKSRPIRVKLRNWENKLSVLL